MKVNVISSQEDLEKLKPSNSDKVILLITNNINLTRSFKPINMENNDVIVFGNNKTISNLNIDNLESKGTGIFSKVKNLYVRNLNIEGARINAEEVCGVLCGDVNGDFTCKNSKVSSVIHADSMAGGLVGVARNIDLDNVCINTYIEARGCIGGVAGMANTYTESNTNVNSTLKSTYSNLAHDTLTHFDVGHLNSREKGKIHYMAKEENDRIDESEDRHEYNLAMRYMGN